jgi:hypothetical protein
VNASPSPRGFPLACAFLAIATALSAPAARADGQSDLRAALVRLGGSAPMKATLEVSTLERRGEGKDAFEKPGQAAVQLEDGPAGLQVRYAPELLARLDAEGRARARDPEAKTPAINALKDVDATEIRPLVAAANALARQLDGATFKTERADTWRGRAARVVRFAIPIETLSAEQKRYVKHFDGTLDVWIAADGTPLASVQHVSVSGRAMVLISFEARDDNERTYAVAGDRLVIVREEWHNVSSGAGEHGDQRIVKTLTVE